MRVVVGAFLEAAFLAVFFLAVFFFGGTWLMGREELGMGI